MKTLRPPLGQAEGKSLEGTPLASAAGLGGLGPRPSELSSKPVPAPSHPCIFEKEMGPPLCLSFLTCETGTGSHVTARLGG